MNFFKSKMPANQQQVYPLRFIAVAIFTPKLVNLDTTATMQKKLDRALNVSSPFLFHGYVGYRNIFYVFVLPELARMPAKSHEA